MYFNKIIIIFDRLTTPFVFPVDTMVNNTFISNNHSSTGELFRHGPIIRKSHMWKGLKGLRPGLPPRSVGGWLAGIPGRRVSKKYISRLFFPTPGTATGWRAALHVFVFVLLMLQPTQQVVTVKPRPGTEYHFYVCVYVRTRRPNKSTLFTLVSI